MAILWPQGRPNRSISSAWTWWAILGFTTLGAVLRLYHIGEDNLVADEAYSLWVARHTLPEIWHFGTRLDTHPPLYYTLLHFSWLVLGDREGALRLLSAVCGTLTIPLVYLLGRIVGGERVGLSTALLIAISPFNVEVGRSARMYALLTLAVALAVLGLAWVLRWPHIAGLRWWTGWGRLTRSSPTRFQRGAVPSILAWMAYGIGTAAALWSHYTSISLPVAANLVVLSSPRYRDLKGGFARNWLLAHLVVVLLCLPMLAILGHQLRTPNLPGWLPAPSLRLVANTFTKIFSGHAFSGRLHLLTDAVGLGLVGLGMWHWRRARRWITFTLALGLVPFIVELLISGVWIRIFLDRTLIWTSIPLFLAVSAGLAQYSGPACLRPSDDNLRSVADRTGFQPRKTKVGRTYASCLHLGGGRELIDI